MNKLIIFDCDGVLVDSEKLTNRVFVDYLKELEIKIDLNVALDRFKGGHMAQCKAEVEALSGCKLPPDFDVTFRRKMAELFETDLLAIEGVEEVLRQLRVPFCVASNGPIEKIEKSLGITKLRPYFGANIFSAYTINKWKPDPDLFLHASSSMKMHPKDCLVIEDSPTGAQAALNAQMQIYGYAADDHCQNLEKLAHKTFKRMSELPRLIEDWLAK